MIIQKQVGGYDHNFSYIVADPKTKDVVVVDPCGDVSLVINELTEHGFNLQAILITHSHFDHIERVDELLQWKSVPVYIAKEAEAAVSFDRLPSFVRDGDRIIVGEIVIQVVHTPGHIDDAVCFYIDKGVNDSSPALITGDTLFVEGCGRTNEHDVETLYDSLCRIKTFDPDTKIYPGHDYGSQPVSTIAHELEHNRFLKAIDNGYDAFVQERLG